MNKKRFKILTLRIGSIQNRNLSSRADLPLFFELFYHFNRISSLVSIAGMRKYRNFIISFSMSYDIFFILFGIFFDNFIPCCDNMWLGTIIGLQLKHLNIWPILLHIEKVLHQSPSSPINTLKIISNQGNICTFLIRMINISTHKLHQLKLNPVSILSLIYKNKIKSILPLS